MVGLQEKMETAMVVESEGMVTEVFQGSEEEEEEGEEDIDLEGEMASRVHQIQCLSHRLNFILYLMNY